MPDITMPHSCEVTSRRIDVVIRNHRDQLMPGEIATLVKAAEILSRIATEDRAAAGNKPKRSRTRAQRDADEAFADGLRTLARGGFNTFA